MGRATEALSLINGYNLEEAKKICSHIDIYSHKEEIKKLRKSKRKKKNENGLFFN